MINHSIIIKSNHWPRRYYKIEKIFKKILKNKQLFKFDEKKSYFFNLVLMDDFFIKKLNKTYKKSNKSTDILTFISNIKNNRVNERHCDIIISAETSKKDAKKNKKNFYDHFTHLIVHSLLHINGYKHNNRRNFFIMKNKEVEILKNIGIPNPY